MRMSESLSAHNPIAISLVIPAGILIIACLSIQTKIEINTAIQVVNLFLWYSPPHHPDLYPSYDVDIQGKSQNIQMESPSGTGPKLLESKENAIL